MEPAASAEYGLNATDLYNT